MPWRRIALTTGGVVGLFAVVFYAWFVFPIQGGVWSVDTDERVVALTFDDGPYPPHTEDLLDVLARDGARATFFMTGSYLQAHPDVAERAVREGHELANHGWDATPLAYADRTTIADHLDRTDAEIAAVGGPRTPHFRPGQGLLGLLGWLEVSQREGSLILVSGGANDWLPPDWREGDCRFLGTTCPTQDADRIAASILAAVEPGAIFVLHDGYAEALGADRSGTVRAVEIILARLREDGYRTVTVSELLALAPSGR